MAIAQCIKQSRKVKNCFGSIVTDKQGYLQCAFPNEDDIHLHNPVLLILPIGLPLLNRRAYF